MHLHYRITTLLASVLLIAPNANANSWGVKNAFCKDRAGGSFSWQAKPGSYEWQVDYENCMQDADRLIREYEERERKRREDLEKWAENHRKKLKEQRRKKEKEEIQKRQEQERIQREDRMRFEYQLNNFDEYFR